MSNALGALWAKPGALEEQAPTQFKFPLVEPFPWQKKFIREFMRNPVLKELAPPKFKGMFKGDGYRNFGLLLPRRCGKDFSVFQMGVFMMYIIPGFNIAYVHRTKTACRAAIMKGTFPAPFPGGPTSFMELVPKEMKATLNKVDGVLSMPNNSAMKFLGADTLDLRGQEVNMVIATEFDFWTRMAAANEQIDAALGRTKGLWVGVSTLKKRGLWYNIMYDTDKETTDTYWRIIQDSTECVNNEGERINTEEYIEMLRRTRRMTEEQIQREFFHNVKSGVYGAVFAEEMTAARKGDRIHKFIDVDPDRPVSTSWDFGSAHPTVILFWQSDGITHYLVDMMEYKRKSPQWIAKRVLQWAKDNSPHEDEPLEFDKHYLAWDACKRDKPGGDEDQGDMVNTETLLRRAGLENTFITGKPPEKRDAINRIRHHFPSLHFSQAKCQKVINALAEYTFKVDTQDRIHDKPDQDQEAADYVDALQSYVLGVDFVWVRRENQKRRTAVSEKLLSSLKSRAARYRRPGVKKGSRWMRR